MHDVQISKQEQHPDPDQEQAADNVGRSHVDTQQHAAAVRVAVLTRIIVFHALRVSRLFERSPLFSANAHGVPANGGGAGFSAFEPRFGC